MPIITYRKLAADETSRLRDIDRTETIRTGYRMDGHALVSMDVVWDCPAWRESGDDHSFPHYIKFLDQVVSRNGTLWGAFDGERLVGIAAFEPDLTDTIGQLSFLHVSNAYRRQGIAGQLFDRVESLARESGSKQLYVSATPSGSAVGFYTSRGCVLNPDPHPEQLALEPEDIHLIKDL